LATFGLFCASLRRFLQAGSTFCGLFSQISFVGFLLPFLRSIFDPFWDFSLRAICLFYGTFWISRCLLDPFSDDFLTVHLVTILPPFTSVELRSVIEPWLAGRQLVQGPAWVYVARIRRISTLLVFPFAIFFRKAN
jgi:hypothetical protein